jgi:inorganic pyrophosphatase
MTNFGKLPTWAGKEHVYAVVETLRGSRAKLEFDRKLGAFRLAKPLLAGPDLSLRLGLHPINQGR